MNDAAPIVAPTLDDPVVAGASAAFGGPLGRHALIGSSWWNPIRVLIGLALIASFLGYMQKYPCRNANWSNGFQYSHVCYNDIYPLYTSEGLSEGLRPYLDPHGPDRDQNVEYPVLIGAAMEIAADAVKPFSDASRARRFVDVTWVLMTIATVIAVVATALTAGRRPWDAAMFATAPGLILAGLINWDLLAVALTSLAMLAWARRHPVVAGVFFGLAVAAKFYPIVLFAPLFLLCLRARKLRSFFSCLAGAIVGWAVVDLPVWLKAPSGFGYFYSFSRTRGVDWGSIWYAAGTFTHHNFAVARVNFYEGVLFALCLIAIGVLVLGARRRPRLPQVFFLTLAAFLVVNKVYSPQYVLWLLPLAVLARPRWPAFLVWQFAEILYFLGIWLYLLNVTRPGKGLEFDPYALSLLARDVGVIALCVLIVIDIMHPERDVVRASDVDDPAGGVLDGVRDSYVPREREVAEVAGATA
jgi:uncharacterized membrane protein